MQLIAWARLSESRLGYLWRDCDYDVCVAAVAAQLNLSERSKKYVDKRFNLTEKSNE